MKLAELFEGMIRNAAGMTAKAKDKKAKAEVFALSRKGHKMKESVKD